MLEPRSVSRQAKGRHALWQSPRSRFTKPPSGVKFSSHGGDRGSSKTCSHAEGNEICGDLWPLGRRRNCMLQRRYANRGSEDVTLGLTTMVPSISAATTPSEDSSYGNIPLRYNNSRVSEWVVWVCESEWVGRASDLKSGVTEWLDHPNHVFPHSLPHIGLPLINFHLKFTPPQSTLTIFRWKPAKLFIYLLQVPQIARGADHRKYHNFVKKIS